MTSVIRWQSRRRLVIGHAMRLLSQTTGLRSQDTKVTSPLSINVLRLELPSSTDFGYWRTQVKPLLPHGQIVCQVLQTLQFRLKKLKRELNMPLHSHRLPLLTQGFQSPKDHCLHLKQRCKQAKLLSIRPSFYRTWSKQHRLPIHPIWASILMPSKQELQLLRQPLQQHRRQQLPQHRQLQLQIRISWHLRKT